MKPKLNILSKKKKKKKKGVIKWQMNKLNYTINNEPDMVNIDITKFKVKV